MNIGFFRDGQNDKSIGRLILFIVTLCGIFVLLLGAFDLLWTMFYEVKHFTEPLEIIGVGTTMLVGSGGGKLLQNKLENSTKSPVDDTSKE